MFDRWLRLRLEFSRFRSTVKQVCKRQLWKGNLNSIFILGFFLNLLFLRQNLSRRFMLKLDAFFVKL